MEPKWTKGPWTTNGTVIQCDSGIHTIGEVSQWLPEFEEERKANAQLIASAPQLYEALRKCAHEVAMLDKEGVSQDVYYEAQAALRAARGES